MCISHLCFHILTLKALVMLLIQLKGILQVLYLLGIIFKMNSVGMNAHLVDQKYSEAHKRGGAPQICFDLQQICTTESLKQPILCCCFLQFHYMKQIFMEIWKRNATFSFVVVNFFIPSLCFFYYRFRQNWLLHVSYEGKEWKWTLDSELLVHATTWASRQGMQISRNLLVICFYFLCYLLPQNRLGVLFWYWIVWKRYFGWHISDVYVYVNASY